MLKNIPAKQEVATVDQDIRGDTANVFNNVILAQVNGVQVQVRSDAHETAYLTALFEMLNLYV